MPVLIRPPYQTPNRWLGENGTEVSHEDALKHITNNGYSPGGLFVVALQDLGRSSVGYIVCNDGEKDALPKNIASWWLVDQTSLNKVSELHRIVR